MGNTVTANYFIGSGNNLSNLQVGNIAGLGNIATINLNGNNSQVLAGDGTWVAQTGGGNSANANYANFAGNVVIASQGNITSLGTLTSLVVSGTSNSANVNLNKFNETVVSGGSVSGTVTPNAAVGTIYQYTLTGNITLNSLNNSVAGTSMTIILTQDATGNRILSSSMKFLGGVKILSTAAAANDIVYVFYDGSTYYCTLTTGYA